jgi:uncharacterized protein
MRFSEGRLSHLAHLVLNTLRQEGLVEIENDRLVLADVKGVLVREQELDERIDAMVRRKIDSLSRHVLPGTQEWDVLYRQYAEEERRKLKPRGA